MRDKSYEEVPVATVCRKTYLGQVQFYELPIFHGFLELLVCGGFFLGQDRWS
jgi:hypothetical protein